MGNIINSKFVTVLGVDPALNNTGWSILKTSCCGDIIFDSVGHISNNIKDDYYCKLENIRLQIDEIIRNGKPNILSIEETFVNGNALSSLKLGVVRGIIMSVALSYKLTIMEFKPNEIKKTITGNGKADKQQVNYMIKTLVPKAIPKTLDESDAIAIATTAIFNY